jgi:RNA polymerase sigma factor (sigma-70 family)
MAKNRVEEHFLANKDRLRVREEAANGSWLAINRGAMTVHAYRRLRSWEAAEDAVQEAYVRALQFQDSFNEEMDFDNWFYIVLMNVVSRAIRNEGLAPEMVEADDSLLTADDFIEAMPEPHHDLMREQHLAGIDRHCASLSNRDESIIRLYYEFGYSRPDVARMISVNEATVHRVLYINKKRIVGDKNV